MLHLRTLSVCSSDNLQPQNCNKHVRSAGMHLAPKKRAQKVSPSVKIAPEMLPFNPPEGTFQTHTRAHTHILSRTQTRLVVVLHRSSGAPSSRVSCLLVVQGSIWRTSCGMGLAAARKFGSRSGYEVEPSQCWISLPWRITASAQAHTPKRST